MLHFNTDLWSLFYFEMEIIVADSLLELPHSMGVLSAIV